MANADSAIGLTPVRLLGGAPYNGATSRFCVPASDNTATYIGSPVRFAGSADADGISHVITATTTGGAVVGVVVSVEPVTRDSTSYREASTLRYVNVATDPNILYEVQCNGTLTATMIGNVADWSTANTGTAATGRSLCEVLISTVSAAGDGTEDFLIVGLVQRPDNEIGADAKVLVRLNNHSFVDAFAGA